MLEATFEALIQEGDTDSAWGIYPRAREIVWAAGVRGDSVLSWERLSSIRVTMFMRS